MRARNAFALVALAAFACAAPAAAQTATRGGGTATAVAVAGVMPAWSPNGQQIAFADSTNSAAGRSWAVYVVGAEGRGRRRVVEVGRDAPHALSWSPDGSRIAYDALDADDQVTTVFTVSASGGRPSKVTAGSAPSWGRQNTLLVADRVPGFSDSRIFVVNPDGSARREVEPCPEAEIGDCADGYPDWSNDGTHIAFDTARGAASAVWVMDADGTNRRIITPFFPPAGHPRWSPDGAKIAYDHRGVESSTSGDLSVMNADGKENRVLVKNGEFPDWSPDGKTIVFARADSLFLIDADGTNERPLEAAAPSRCIVPNVVGKTVATAKALLLKANCKTGKITRVRSLKVRRGRVVSSRPKAGTSRPAGTAVALAVSRGR